MILNYGELERRAYRRGFFIPSLKNVVAAGADTWSYDVVPPIDLNEPYPGHQILLKENGIYILEAMSTGELAKDNVYEFLFVLGQAKVRGAVQMIINPIAIN